MVNGILQDLNIFERVEVLETKVDNLIKKVDNLIKKVDNLSIKVDNLDKKFDDMSRTFLISQIPVWFVSGIWWTIILYGWCKRI